MKKTVFILVLAAIALNVSAFAATNRLGSIRSSQYVVTSEDDPTVPSWAKQPDPPQTGLSPSAVTNVAEAVVTPATNALNSILRQELVPGRYHDLAWDVGNGSPIRADEASFDALTVPSWGALRSSDETMTEYLSGLSWHPQNVLLSNYGITNVYTMKQTDYAISQSLKAKRDLYRLDIPDRWEGDAITQDKDRFGGEITNTVVAPYRFGEGYIVELFGIGGYVKKTIDEAFSTAQEAENATNGYYLGWSDGPVTKTAAKDVIATRTDVAAATNGLITASDATNAAAAVVAATRTAYATTNAIVSLNQSVQYVVANGTPLSIVAPAPETGGIRDWLVYVNATADTPLDLSALSGVLASDASATNAAKANAVTMLAFTEMTNGVYILGRSELKPVK